MKLNNWPTLLATFLLERHKQPFAWGVNDCCLFAADAVHTITGVDPAPEFRGHYRTAIGAKRALIRYGAGEIKPTFDAKFGELKPRLTAQRGDIALLNIDGNYVVGVVFGTIYVVSQTGLLQLPLNKALGIWSIN
jgi:hypothetical protein